ncbi:SDR family NAD(P)-dependent oxidoreductase [Cryptosporangium aurantiacum]|uniref:NADP-dependent 3-hydroxy acid dehydrogenase YdfG n=1 Tax=Cryptosporangium aurantiacum TaxID=134849 RepID=A0A1M7R548_9ACTN|nr:SDR family NAD(P)-dependent oxidoreductase [Cryptosporangium aurantiacum]SHN40192.1 NADP-dependent 3-hydroxy acid dehydrogenase YdfG [Cryptosporangium aurantiacum]
MAGQFKDQVVVVTGAAGGIGLGIAKAFADEGATVVVADIKGSAAESAAAQLATPGLAVTCDVTDRRSVEALADAAWNAYGRVDVVVNNAGIFPPPAAVIDADEANVRWTLEVNVIGVWNGCSVFGKRLVEQGTPAHIVNLGSENSLGVPHTHGGIYTASKHAVLGLSDVLRRELPDHVKVSVLCPGIVPSDLGSAVRHRPDRFGGPVTDGPTTGPAADMGIPADEVGRKVVEGVLAGEFYIVTHPPVRELADERHAEISAAFERQAPRFDGDERLDTRKVLGLA